jgi:hypothetical protein
VYADPIGTFEATVTVAALDAPLLMPIEAGENVTATLPSITGPFWPNTLPDNETRPDSLPRAIADIAVALLLPGGIVSDGGDALSAKGLVTSNSICAVAVFPLLSVPVRLIV